jgi:hypothetical protein
VERSVSVYNPSDAPVYVQLLPFLHSSASPAFSLSEESLRGKIIAPRSYSDVGTIIFFPLAVFESYATTLYLKNNLTIVDALAVRGEVTLYNLSVSKHNVGCNRSFCV